MNRPDMALVGSGAVVSRATHASREYQPDIVDCCEVVDRHTGLDYIAHLTSGTWDFSAHLESPYVQAREFQQAAKQLSLIVNRIDSTAQQLGSGPLIRVVVQGSNGALFSILKVEGQNLFGATLEGSRAAIDQVDRDLAELADRAAHRVGSTSMLWGGYRKRGATGEWDRPYGEPDAATERYRLRPGTAAGQQAIPAEVARLCSGVLDYEDVHFVGVYRGDTPLWRADLFADPPLASQFQRVTPTTRRRGYGRVMHQVILQADRINRLLAVVNSDRPTRLVLDVARGAIYVLPLGDREHYLVGVTLTQTQVDSADRKMTALYQQLAMMPFRPDGVLPSRPGSGGVTAR